MTVHTLRDLADAALCPLLVVKLGSSLLVDAAGRERADWLAGLLAELARQHRAGQRIVIVSSGAIALGAARLGLPGRPRESLADSQAAASVGQVRLAGLYDRLLHAEGIVAAQMLVTLGDLENRRSYLNAAATLERLLAQGCVPVVNENDSVATEEIRFGDNDRLAARVAQAAGADAVLLFSDVDGLYDRAPGEEGARLLTRIETIDDELRAAAGPSASRIGTGGMASKLAAAEIATRAGISLAIGNGTVDRPFERIAAEGVGTLFIAQDGPMARKTWLGGRLSPGGTVSVDPGCASALRDGASLLAVGMTGVEGDFARGDLVRLVDESGQAIAQGLVEYDAATCRALAGKRQGEQEALLGHAPRRAVVHRDHLVLL